MHSQPPPKGSLEDLFRHHLLESEAAAVPPRPLVWDHIDNSLLLAENEKYRRRLLVHRWSLAASLLLAALAGGGWWHSQQVATATLASANAQREDARRAVAGAVAPTTLGSAATAATTLAVAPTQRVAGSRVPGGATTGQPTANSEAEQTSGNVVLARTGQVPAASAQTAANATMAYSAGQRQAGAGSGAGTMAYTPAGLSAHGTGRLAGAVPARTRSFYSPNVSAIAATTTSSSVDSPEHLPTANPLGLSSTASQLEGTTSDAATAALADSRLGEGLLATRLTALAVPPASGLPTELAPKDISLPAPTLLRQWRYGAEYAAGAFQPNIDFNRNASDYNTALGLNTVTLTRAAAAEYRANLRPGLSQRLTLRATRWLGGRWSLSTGVEVAQQEAYSATSAAFTGEQLADLNSFSTSSFSSSNYASYRDLRESSFRYRSAGIPIELQYDNQVKQGISFYGRLGAIVSALLSVRSEVAGNPEATHTYSFTSASTPYRRLTALLRGSAGVRYRSASRNWGLHAGPTAEAGVQSMNAETDRSFLQQSRPYSVGIEAGIEFGGGLKPVNPLGN